MFSHSLCWFLNDPSLPPPLVSLLYFPYLLLFHSLCLSLSGSNTRGVTCSSCLYPFPVSFVVTLLYRRISKGNNLSRGVPLRCTFDTGELRIYSLLSFSFLVCLHITARITVWFLDKLISLDLSHMGCRFVLILSNFTVFFCGKPACAALLLCPLITWNEMKEAGSCIVLAYFIMNFLSLHMVAQMPNCST